MGPRYFTGIQKRSARGCLYVRSRGIGAGLGYPTGTQRPFCDRKRCHHARHSGGSLVGRYSAETQRSCGWKCWQNGGHSRGIGAGLGYSIGIQRHSWDRMFQAAEPSSIVREAVVAQYRGRGQGSFLGDKTMAIRGCFPGVATETW